MLDSRVILLYNVELLCARAPPRTPQEVKMKIIKKITALMIMSAIIAASFSFSASAASAVKGSEVAKFAATLEGCGYKYSSKGPDKFDCSGLVYYVLAKYGITFGHSTSVYNTAEEAKSFGKVIKDMSQAKEGDIVVWSGHAAVYLGNGSCVHAMNEKKGVIINKVEDFVDSKGVKNPSHFFIRPYGYAEETAEEKAPSTAPAAPKEEKLSFRDKIVLMIERIADFIKAPFMPVVNAIR